MTELAQKLWCDLSSDEERLEFILSGRAVETGIIAPSIVDDAIKAFKAAVALDLQINGEEE